MIMLFKKQQAPKMPHLSKRNDRWVSQTADEECDFSQEYPQPL